VKERPILFNGAMVRAILSGAKTQTRRVVKARADKDFGPRCVLRPHEIAGEVNGGSYRNSPYGEPGDRLWVRETWARDDEDGALMYRADVGRDMNANAWEQGRLEGVPRYKWRPSIFMPRTASRITLEVTDVRVERLREISESDAGAEGIRYEAGSYEVDWMTPRERGLKRVADYRLLWESINGAGSWDANPWVWVVSFRRVQP
jgi:hypothetical protein